MFCYKTLLSTRQILGSDLPSPLRNAMWKSSGQKQSGIRPWPAACSQQFGNFSTDKVPCIR